MRREIRYDRGTGTCWKCGMIDYLCGRESSRTGRQVDCAWPNVVVPLLYGLWRAAAAKESLYGRSTRACTALGRVGYGAQADRSRAGFARWIGSIYRESRVFSRVVSRGVFLVVFLLAS